MKEANAAEVAAPARASFSGVAPPRPSEPTRVHEDGGERAAPAMASQM